MRRRPALGKVCRAPPSSVAATVAARVRPAWRRPKRSASRAVTRLPPACPIVTVLRLAMSCTPRPLAVRRRVSWSSVTRPIVRPRCWRRRTTWSSRLARISEAVRPGRARSRDGVRLSSPTVSLRTISQSSTSSNRRSRSTKAASFGPEPQNRESDSPSPLKSMSSPDPPLSRSRLGQRGAAQRLVDSQREARASARARPACRPTAGASGSALLAPTA